MFSAGISETRLGVIWLAAFVTGELPAFNCPGTDVNVACLEMVGAAIATDWTGKELVWSDDPVGGFTGTGVNVIRFGATLAAGLVGVIFIGTVNMLILLTGSFLMVP